ncbi:MAG: hypothetical protein OEM19_06980, partial [Deltaproteobacteria bacterium]|nr:hypothetical protein [Deltaproteobacteria bacterium]
HTTVTNIWSLRLLRCDVGVAALRPPILQLLFILDSHSIREYSRETPTARKEVVNAVIALMTEAMNAMFSSIPGKESDL